MSHSHRGFSPVVGMLAPVVEPFQRFLVSLTQEQTVETVPSLDRKLRGHRAKAAV
jgi:hypothetical protein